MTRTITIESQIHFERRGRGSRKSVREGTAPTPTSREPGRVPRVARLMALAIRFDELIQAGEVADYAELARLAHVTRARITQIMNLRMLAPDIQEAILLLRRGWVAETRFACGSCSRLPWWPTGGNSGGCGNNSHFVREDSGSPPSRLECRLARLTGEDGSSWKMGSALSAIKQILSEAGEPLHYREITRRVLAARLWQSDGETPEATVNAQLTSHIKKYGKDARISRVGSGVYKLNGAFASPTKARSKSATKSTKFVSFTDAAEQVLTRLGDGQPMHFREITEKALELGLIRTSGRTPAATMYGSVFEEIKRYQRRGEQPRFRMPGKGMICMAKSLPTGIPSQVEQHNRKVRTQLHARLMSMSFGELEELVGVLLAKLGFEDVAVTTHRGDKGIDVRGTLVVGESVRIRMAVQVKRWKDNVQAPMVQQVRGSLGTHEQGLIITTSDFSPGARKEAIRVDAAPVGLMNGEQLINLMLEHEIGVSKASLDLFEVAPFSEHASSGSLPTGGQG